MKRLLTAVTVTGILALGNAVSADPPSTPDEQTSVEASRAMPGAMIDNIIVPYEVMIYVETKYPGHTVTEAREEERDGKEAYRLRVDSDTWANDRESLYLYYDKDWELIEEVKRIAPPPKIESEKPKPKDEPKEDKPENSDRDDARGGSNEEGPDPRTITPEEPEPEEDSSDSGSEPSGDD